MDVLGERAIAKGMRMVGKRPPREPSLHRLALAGDLATNSLFYAMVGKGPGLGCAGRFSARWPGSGRCCCRRCWGSVAGRGGRIAERSS